MHELPAGGRLAILGAFVGLTFIWILPMGVLLRYGGMRQLRKYILDPR